MLNVVAESLWFFLTSGILGIIPSVNANRQSTLDITEKVFNARIAYKSKKIGYALNIT